MRKVLLLACLVAATGSLLAQSPTPESIISTFRVKPKPGQGPELEKALIAHATQFHKGDAAWRIFRVMSGDDSGMLQVTEGSTTFARLEERGDLGAAHMADYANRVVPLIAATGPERYSRVLTEYSTTSFGGSARKVLMRYYYPKPGQSEQLLKQLKLVKPVWEKLGYEVVVYRTFYSGETRISTARRLKNGFKDLSSDANQRFSATFDAIHGTGAFEKMFATMSDTVNKVDEAILELVATPNSK